MSEPALVRDAVRSDAESVAAIYNHYIENTVITFEETQVTHDQIAARMESIQRDYCWLVLETDERVGGYVYARRWHERAAYRHSVESSVFLHPDLQGRGYGTLLYEELFRRLTPPNLHVVIAGITLPNEASVGLHEKFGFTKVAHYREVGRKFDRWLDVGYWQKFITELAEDA